MNRNGAFGRVHFVFGIFPRVMETLPLLVGVSFAKAPACAGITEVMLWIGSGFGMVSDRDGLCKMLPLPPCVSPARLA